MNDEVTKFDLMWKEKIVDLKAAMEAERKTLEQIEPTREKVREIQARVDAYENDLVIANTGKGEGFRVNGTNEATRKQQASVLIAEYRLVEENLVKLHAELDTAKQTLKILEYAYESLKDAIEISRLTLSHIDAVLRALATP
jgi:hypothetical protein